MPGRVNNHMQGACASSACVFHFTFPKALFSPLAHSYQALLCPLGPLPFSPLRRPLGKGARCRDVTLVCLSHEMYCPAFPPSFPLFL